MSNTEQPKNERFTVRQQSSGRTRSISFYVYDQQAKGRVTSGALSRQQADAKAASLNATLGWDGKPGETRAEAVTPAPAAELPKTWYVLRGSRLAHYAASTEQDERDGVVRPICGKLSPMPGFRVRQTRAADYDCPDCAEELGEFYSPRPERDPADRRAGLAAYCAMSAIASQMTDARERGDRVAYADLRASMNDLRAAYTIALSTPLSLITRDGYSLM